MSYQFGTCNPLTHTVRDEVGMFYLGYKILCRLAHVCICMVITYSRDQPGKVANPARGQLNREKIFPCPRACLRIWSRETGSAVPSRASLLISILRLNLVLTYEIPPEFRGGVHL